MNSKKGIVLLTVCVIAIFLAACNNSSQQESHPEERNDPAQNENSQEDLALSDLLPDEEGYTWKYDGAVEYGHEMELKMIEESGGKAIYHVEGAVEDVSGGESKMDFSLALTYTITKDTLTQTVDSEMMMDNIFPEIELIRLPLTEGETWTQTQENAEGEEITLESTIESIEIDGEQKIYTVTYEDADSNYYEQRKMKEGVGVIDFEHLYIFEDNEGSMPMGYTINDEFTGYLDRPIK